MLHGDVLTFHLSFDSLLPALTAERKVIRVELQGHGHTADGDRPFSIRQCAEDVIALLVSTDVAVLAPDRVGRVVLAASHVRPAAY